MLSWSLIGSVYFFFFKDRPAGAVHVINWETNVVMALRVENGENKEGHDVAAVTYANISKSLKRENLDKGRRELSR